MLSKGLFAPCETRADGPDGDAQHLRNFGIVEVGHVTQHEGDPEVMGNLRQCRGNGARLVEVVGQVGGGVRIGIRCLGSGENGRISGTGGTTDPTDFVDCGVGGDAVDPGRQTRTSVEAGETPNDREESVLYRIIGALAGQHHAVAHGMDRVVVQSQQSINRVAFAGAGPHEKVGLVAPELCGVDGPGVHARRLVVGRFGPLRGLLRPR